MIPEHVVLAVNTLLAPYGETYSPVPRQREYLSPKEAAGYLGVSVTTLNVIVRKGSLRRIKLHSSRNGTAKYEKADLDQYMNELRLEKAH